MTEKVKNYIIAGLCVIILIMIIYVSSCNKPEKEAVYLPSRDTTLQNYIDQVLLPKLDSIQDQGNKLQTSIDDKKLGLKILEYKYHIKSNEIKNYSSSELDTFIRNWIQRNKSTK